MRRDVKQRLNMQDWKMQDKQVYDV